nr:patronin-like isoform X20 [Aedes albopictus]
MDSQQAPQPRSAYEMETQESRFAKQRASVKWLLSKAYNNRVPEFLKDPFYRDHEGQDHLKPQIVVGLGNASIYCQVLSNIYSDPNYQSLNHWSILQTLSRKGVPLNESSDLPLTETVLIQTNPLRINAHMTVIEALMVLYAKEVASSGRISSALERISGRSVSQGAQHHEAALLSWISHVCSALKRRIDYELTNGVGGGGSAGSPPVDEYGQRLQSPTIAPVRDFRELCDGVCLAYLISYYCPKLVPWHSVKFNHVPTIEDSIHNILIVSNFSERSLPYSVFHMTPEDITYMRGAMKQNLVVLLADLFNLFEIHPAKCVCYPGMEQQQVADSAATNEHGIAHRRGFATHPPILAIPELRSGLDSPPGSGGSGASAGSGGSGNGGAHPRPPFQVTRSPSASTLRKHVSSRDMHDQQPQYSQHSQQSSHQPYHQDHQDEGFVVHRSKGVPTLSSMQEPLVPARIRQAKEKTNNDSKAEERGDSIPAGRPSNWEENRKQSFSGRRSRRNSLSEDSQLTIENFGGSQDQLNTIGRFERERKTSSASLTSVEPVTPARSSIADARGSIQFGYDTDSSGNEKQDRDTEKPTPALRRHNSTNLHSNSGGGGGIDRGDIIDGDMSSVGGFGGGGGAGPVSVADVETTPRRKTSFATLPNNTTTWQQQAISVQKMEDVDDSQSGFEDATKISTIKLKLEEKRRLIEQEKRRMETAWSKQLQTVGKQAFLQAINKQGKGGGGGGSMSESYTSKESPENATNMMMVEDSITTITSTSTVDRAERPCSLKDLDDQSKYESKWNAQIIEPKKTPDLENMDLEQYQQSISKMNSNLHDIQADIQRLTQQQTQIQAQTLQAQQLLHAQQIANLLNQQYGSQQNIQQIIHGTYRPINAQLFGSSPHLPQQNAPPLLQQQSPINYGTRPPSRDPYLTQQQQLHTLQYVNDQGQYIQQAQQQQQQHYMGYENGQYRKENQYSSNPYLNIDQQQQQFYQDSNHYRDPYLPQEVKEPPIQQSQQPQHNQFFLHDSSGGGGGGTPPQPAQRRTWAQSAAAAANQRGSSASSEIQLDINAWNQGIKSSPYNNKSPSQSGFSLHHNGDSGAGGDGYGTGSRYGGSQQSFQNLFEVHHGSSGSPQHSRVRNQISQMINHGVGSSNSSPGVETRSHHDSFRDNRNMPLSPPIDDMAPQSISFIGDEDTGDIEINTSKGTSFTLRHQAQQHQQDQLEQLYGSSKQGSNKMQQNNGPELNKHLSKLNITSGNRTYRIPSPTRPTLNSNSFHDPQQDDVNEKGFYISFDNEQPKRPKPPLRTKRSPKKDKLGDSLEHSSKESEKPSHRENNQNNFGTFSVKTANSFSANFNEEQVVSRKSIIDSATSPFETAATATGSNHRSHSSQLNNNNIHSGSSMAATMMERDIGERRHLEDVTNHTGSAMNNNNIIHHHHHYNNNNNGDGYGSENENQRKAKLVIGSDEANLDPNSVDEMERKKEKIMLLSLQRRQQAEEAKARKEIEAMQRREKEREKEEERARKKEEQFARRQAILEAHKLKKAIEEAEREGKTIDRELLIKHQQSQAQLQQSSRGGGGGGGHDGMHHQTSSTPSAAAKMRPQKLTRPRPKTIHVETGSVDLSETSSLSSRGKKGSNSNLTDSDSGLGRATPPRRAPSPGMGPSSRHLPSPSGPGSLPPGLITKRRGFDDGSSDISSTASSMMDYNGPKLYKQPATKSNRGIILNAVEYCVFPGAVNREAKQKVLEKIARSEAKHFLVLFRDAGCQFRALYGYWPENEQIIKLYGTGPSQVDDVMFDKFFKYNSGGKCFSQVHTKHLTVTIDAFTIHNSLWQGKKANLPSKKDMALVI